MSDRSPGRWEERQGASPVGRRERLRAHLRTRSRYQRWIADEFHSMYYEQADRTWGDTRWNGVGISKTPLDLWIYQELLVELQPDLLVETGTFYGGSALFYAQVMDLAGKGQVVSIDLDSETVYPQHPRITHLNGSSVDDSVVEQVRRLAEEADRVMVVLDSEHAAPHVSAELDAYSGLVTPGSFLVVEDTNINGHPVAPGWGPGPHEALTEFLPRHPEFVRDPIGEKFFFSFNQGGWLRRVR